MGTKKVIVIVITIIVFLGCLMPVVCRQSDDNDKIKVSAVAETHTLTSDFTTTSAKNNSETSTEVSNTTKESIAEIETTNIVVAEKTTKTENTSSDIKAETTMTSAYPLTYSDDTCSIVIEKKWFEDAWCYIAKLKFTDYDRFGTAPANGTHLNGLETTSHFAKRYGAIFAVNGDYACPDTGNTAIRSGVVYTDKNCCVPAVYNAHTGIFDSPSNLGIRGQLFSTLVEEKKVTDSFTFWSWSVVNNGEVVHFDDTSRAQRTTIGSNGKPGEIIIVVSEGRYADGESSGLTFNQCGRLMKSLGCTVAVPLDGGGSSTMYFNGQVLNSANYNQRAVKDFVYLKK